MQNTEYKEQHRKHRCRISVDNNKPVLVRSYHCGHHCYVFLVTAIIYDYDSEVKANEICPCYAKNHNHTSNKSKIKLGYVNS